LVFVLIFVLALIPSLTELVARISKFPGRVFGIVLEVLSRPVSLAAGFVCRVLITPVGAAATGSQKGDPDKKYRPE
jgi:hypothetical protein